MAINAKDFTFCDKKLSDFGFMIADFDNSLDDSASCGNIELITTRPPMSANNIVHGISYGDPIKLDFQIVKFDFANCICSETPVTNEEQENLMRWLIKRNYNYIYFDDDIHLCFNVHMNVTPKKVGGVIRGFQITATNDSVYSYSVGRAMSLNNGENLFTDESSVVGYMYPSFRIVADASGDVVVEHKEDDRKMVISNCLPGEELLIDCKHKTIKSNVAAHNLSSDFNFVFTRLFNTEETRENTITVTNSRYATMFYRFNRMVVI